jgi:hypothetical protein
MRTATVTSPAARAAAALLAALALGCSDDGTAPSAPRPDATAGDATGAAAAQTAAQSAAQSADTTRPSTFPAVVRVRGQLLATTWTPGRTGADTVSGFEPVRGARITLYRNVLVDGRGVSQRIGERETGADGAFAFDDVPGGPYVLALNVTAARPYGDAVWYLMGNAAEVSTTLRLWTRPAQPADSTRGP